MTMPGRNYSSNLYRYGFSGHEKFNEIAVNGNLIDFGERIYDSRIGIFKSIDRFTSKYPNKSPYTYAGNSPLAVIDIKGDSLYILFYTSGNDRGDNMFKAAALTRQYDIENNGHFDPCRDKVVVLDIQNLSSIKDKVESTVKEFSPCFGKTSEFGIWSHSALDGPRGTKPTNKDDALGKNQMSLTGWGKINFNWAENATAGIWGCRSGVDDDGSGSFITKISTLSNFKNVKIQGQTDYSFPSFFVDYRYNEGRDDKDESNYLPVNGYNKTYLIPVSLSKRIYKSFFVTPGSPSEPIRTAKNGSGVVAGYANGDKSPPRNTEYGRPKTIPLSNQQICEY